MFFNNRRVEEELEKIRKANLPPPKADEEVASITSEAVDWNMDVSVDGYENVDGDENIDGEEINTAANIDNTGTAADYIKSSGAEASESTIAEASESNVVEVADTADIAFTAKDLLAMTIAALSIVLPYVAIFILMTIIFFYLFLG
ncbi:MAG: hypothetical protein FWD38_02765 [Oscillospiraceae bacterium]|nr:hypothetical protein [Oscillospiraceae bacterium]